MKIYWARFFKEEDGRYSVDVPDMPGCFTCGDTIEEAYTYLVEEAMPLWLEDQQMPPASTPDEVLSAPTYEGAAQPILVRVLAEENQGLADILATAVQSDMLVKAAREYLSRVNA